MTVTRRSHDGYTRAQAGRAELLSTFLDLTTGEYANARFVKYYKATQFELIPEPRKGAEPGYIAVDGELWPLAATSITVRPLVCAHLCM